MLAFDLAVERAKLDDLGARYEAGSGSGVGRILRNIADSIGIDVKKTTDPAILGDYGSFDELAKDYTQREQYYNRAKALQESTALKDEALNAPDFFRMSLEGRKMSGSDEVSEDKTLREWWDSFTNEAKMTLSGEREEFSPWDDSLGKTSYHYMTDEEKSIYNYYLAKNGKAKAEEYRASIQDQLNQREAGELGANMEDKAALEILFGAVAAADRFGTSARTLVTGEVLPTSSVQYAGQIAREGLADAGAKLPEWAGGASLGQMAYDAVDTGMYMVPSILTSAAVGMINPIAGAVAGGALLGATAAGNAYSEMVNAGYSEGQAKDYAAMIGASEAGLQMLLGGITKLGGLVPGGITEAILKNVDNAFARTAIKLGGNMLGEFSEEYLQEVLTPWFENLTLYTDNDIKFFSPDALYAGLLGAITAGVLEGGGTIAGEAQNASLGNKLRDNNITAERLANIGKTFSADTVAYRLANKVNENTGAYTIGRLFNEIGAVISEQNKAAITESLTAKGMDSKNAKLHADVMEYIVNGGEVSDL